MIFCIGLNPAIDKTLEISNFQINSHQKAKLLRLQAAGKAANVARILSKSDIDVELMGFVGCGEKDFFHNSFSEGKVSFCPTEISGQTRVNTTIIDPVLRSETHIREEGFEVSPKKYDEFEDSLLGRIGCGDMVVFCGSLPLGVEEEVLVATFGKILEKGVKLGGDFSGRILSHIKNLPLSFLKPNREEFSELCGKSINSTEELCEYAEKAADFGIKIENLLVSDGKNGAGLFSAQSGSLWGNVPEVAIKSTVGAGDALLSGYITAITRKNSMEDALRSALAYSLSAVGKVEAGEVDILEIEQFYENLTAIRLR